MQPEYFFFIIILIMAGFILLINRKRNAWDIMFFNTTLAIVVLFVIGILSPEHWKEIVYALGAVGTGTGIAGIFRQRKSNP